MIVKICGLTNLEDAECAIQAGADLVGFVSLPESPRYLPPSDVAAIVNKLSQPEKAVLLVDKDSLGIVSSGPWTIVQIYGLNSASQIPDIDKRIIVSVSNESLHRFSGFDRVLDKSHGKGLELEKADIDLCDVILAGGLHPGNVAEKIRQFRPQGVDVSSGVESAVGQKDHQLLHEFIVNARTAFAELEERKS